MQPTECWVSDGCYANRFPDHKYLQGKRYVFVAKPLVGLVLSLTNFHVYYTSELCAAKPGSFFILNVGASKLVHKTAAQDMYKLR